MISRAVRLSETQSTANLGLTSPRAPRKLIFGNR